MTDEPDKRTAATGDVEARVSALSNALRDTEAELDRLTGGQLETVSDIRGEPFLLRGGQERLRQQEVIQRQTAVTLNSILNALPVHVALLDDQANILTVNETWRSFGAENGLQSSDFCVGQNYLAVCERAHGSCAEQVRAAANGIRAILNGEAAECDLAYRCDSPTEERWFRMLARRVIQPGQKDGAVVMHIDITATEKAKRRIEEQAAYLDAAREAIFVKDCRDIITYWNKGAERIYGWTAAEAVGRKAFEMFGLDEESVNKWRQEVMAKGEWSGELTRRNKAGVELAVESSWTQVRDGSGQPDLILVIDNDITEKKLLETKFLRSQRMESVGTLAGGIAHDLNNVLSPILMSAELLKIDETNEDRIKLLATVQECGQRGASLIKLLLGFSRGVDGKRIAVNCGHLARDVHRMMRETFPKSIQLKLSVSNDLWSVKGDPTQLHQVILNLCVNARDAMPSGGKLSLGVQNVEVDEVYSRMNPSSKPGAYVRIEVEDSGCGIPKEIQARIFDPFFTTKESGKGTGLGLATVLSIVNSHSGFVNLYSEAGAGARFRVYLPAVFELSEHAEAGEKSPTVQRGVGELILVVDDEESLRLTAQLALERNGYRTILAGNGAEALALYVKHQAEIALVLTDLAMPVMDGAAAIAALKVINPEVKVILTSGLDSAKSVFRAMTTDTKHFIQKPYGAEALLKLMREVLTGDDGKSHSASAH